MVRCDNKLEKYNKNSEHFNKSQNSKKSRNFKFYDIPNLKRMYNDVRISSWNDDGGEEKNGYWRTKKITDKKSTKKILKKSGGQLKEGFNKKFKNKT